MDPTLLQASDRPVTFHGFEWEDQSRFEALNG